MIFTRTSRMLLNMRITIDLDDGLVRELKRLTIESGSTLTSVIHNALRESLSRRQVTTQDRVDLPVFHGTGLRPGVDLSDAASLQEIMEAPIGPS